MRVISCRCLVCGTACCTTLWASLYYSHRHCTLVGPSTKLSGSGAGLPRCGEILGPPPFSCHKPFASAPLALPVPLFFSSPSISPTLCSLLSENFSVPTTDRRTTWEWGGGEIMRETESLPVSGRYITSCEDRRGAEL